MAYAIRVHKTGGPESLKYEEVDVGAPGAGEIRLKQHAIGVNYIDVYLRTGLYPQPSSPFVPGMEGAGEVTAVGSGVSDLKVGDRVAYAGPAGGYASERLIPADRVVKMPDGIDYKTAAAMMLQGMTVRYLVRKTYNVGPGTTCLWHAAAGGVGLIACQWVKHLGGTLIGTAGGPEKCKLALDHGAAHCIDYKKDTDFVAKVKEITGGKLCDVVYDSIGKDTYPASLDCLKPRGMFVTFGNASGPIEAINPGILAAKGSLFVTRPSLAAYTATRADLVETANDLFDVVSKGAVKINVNHTYALKDAAQAHIDLEARKTTGSIILLP
ncbi:MAG: quinone oxidoreductase [Hyphomicrobiaceae bacterium]